MADRCCSRPAVDGRHAVHPPWCTQQSGLGVRRPGDFGRGFAPGPQRCVVADDDGLLRPVARGGGRCAARPGSGLRHDPVPPARLRLRRARDARAATAGAARPATPRRRPRCAQRRPGRFCPRPCPRAGRARPARTADGADVVLRMSVKCCRTAGSAPPLHPVRGPRLACRANAATPLLRQSPNRWVPGPRSSHRRGAGARPSRARRQPSTSAVSDPRRSLHGHRHHSGSPRRGVRPFRGRPPEDRFRERV